MFNRLELEATLSMVSNWIENGSFDVITEKEMKAFQKLIQDRLEEPKQCNHRWRLKKPKEGEPLAPEIYCAKCGEIQLHELTTMTGVVK